MMTQSHSICRAGRAARKAILLLVLWASVTATHNPLRAQIVRGQVIDSIGGVPITDAGVVLLDPSGAAVDRTITDDAGVFVLHAPHSGEYRLKVEYVGYRSTFATFTIESDEVQGFLLRFPLPAAVQPELTIEKIVARVCPEGAVRSEEGVLLGIVRHAMTEEPVAGAEVTFSWPPVSGRLAELVRSDELDDYEGVVTTDSMGFYAACGLLRHTLLTVHVLSSGDLLSDFVTVRFASEGVFRNGQFHRVELSVWREDFLLAPPTLRTASVTGVVIETNTAAPLAEAEVQIAGTSLRATTGSDGSFTLTALPSGSMKLVVRRTGFKPVQLRIDLRDDTNVVIPAGALGMQPLPAALAPVTVEAERPETRRPLADFFERRDHSGGRFITREEFEKQGSPQKPTDVLRRMGGIRIVRNPNYAGRFYVLMSRTMGKRSIELQQGPCFPLIFIDRHYMGRSDEFDIDIFLPLLDVEAVEAHSGLAAPREFARRGFQCGVIAFWTR